MLIVSLLSLVLVIALASGGDRLLSALKTGDEKESGTAPPSSGTVQHERKNLGLDSNPFGLFGPGRKAQTLPVRAPRPLQLCRPGRPP